MRSTILLAAAACNTALDTLSLLQQQVVVDVNDYDYDYDHAEEYMGKGKEGKAGRQEPTPAPTELPTPAPTETPAPTPPGQCMAYDGSEAVADGQIPYQGMVACQTSTWGGIAHAKLALTNAVSPVWPGTCTATNGGTDNAWWVDLAKTSIVESVQLTNRKSCCNERLHNVDIFVGGELCANTGTSPGDGQTVTYPCASPLTGKDIMLRSNSGAILTLCGFAAFGKAA